MPERRHRRWPRKRKVFAGLILIVATMGAAGYWHLATQSERMLRAAIAEADATDPGWRLADLVAGREAIPDEANSAVQILEASRHIPGGWPLRRGESQETNALIGINALAADVALAGPVAAQLRGELAKHPRGRVEARKLADMPRGRHTPTLARNRFVAIQPHIDACRNVARFLQSDSALRAHEGDIDGALESCRALLNVGRSIGDEPILMSQLVRAALQSMSIAGAQRALGQGQASDAALATYQAALIEDSRFPSALVMMRGERASIDDLLERLSTGIEDMSVLSGGPPPGRGARALRMPMSGIYFRHNRALILRQMNRAVEVARRPDADQVGAWSEWEGEFRPASPGLLEGWAAALTLTLTPSIAAAVRSPMRGRAAMAATIAALSCERHRLAHGRFPDSIATIDPRFAKALLPDPYTGRPVAIKADGDRLIAYTTGLDRVDDGGKVHPKNLDKAGFDIGWTLWTPEGRRKPPMGELPADVFQAIPGHPAELRP